MELKAGLYIVSTPIGNLEDITLRALYLLKNCNLIYCEDTRTTYKLLQKHNIQDKKLAVYNDHSDEKIRNKILNEVENNNIIVLVSDAGTPLISDPGYKLIRFLQEKNIHIDVIPGPCAAITGLVISGLPTDKFYFGGFMPRTKIAKNNLLTSLENLDSTLIFYDSPSRIFETLISIQESLDNREVAVIRELTKIYQQNIRKPVTEIINNFEQIKTKGEFIILISPVKAYIEIKEDQLASLIQNYKAQGKTTKDIAEEILRKYPGKFTKNYIYKLSKDL